MQLPTWKLTSAVISVLGHPAVAFSGTEIDTQQSIAAVQHRTEDAEQTTQTNELRANSKLRARLSTDSKTLAASLGIRSALDYALLGTEQHRDSLDLNLTLATRYVPAPILVLTLENTTSVNTYISEGTASTLEAGADEVTATTPDGSSDSSASTTEGSAASDLDGSSLGLQRPKGFSNVLDLGSQLTFSERWRPQVGLRWTAFRPFECSSEESPASLFEGDTLRLETGGEVRLNETQRLSGQVSRSVEGQRVDPSCRDYLTTETQGHRYVIQRVDSGWEAMLDPWSLHLNAGITTSSARSIDAGGAVVESAGNEVRPVGEVMAARIFGLGVVRLGVGASVETQAGQTTPTFNRYQSLEATVRPWYSLGIYGALGRVQASALDDFYVSRDAGCRTERTTYRSDVGMDWRINDHWLARANYAYSHATSQLNADCLSEGEEIAATAQSIQVSRQSTDEMANELNSTEDIHAFFVTIGWTFEGPGVRFFDGGF